MMKGSKIIIITFILLFFPSFLFAVSNQFPIYSGAKGIKEYSLKDGLIKGIFYKVKIPYPAKEVLDFYEKEMKKMGYIPFVEEDLKYADRTWQTFQDTTKRGSPYVNQLIAYWVNPQKTKRVVLGLRYCYYVKPNNSKVVLGYNDDLEVTFQIMPFEKRGRMK